MRDATVPAIRPMPATSARVHVVEPHGFNDAQEVGDRLKADQPVIINLQGLSRDLQRRMIDFSSGLTYAVGGSMSRVADQVFLLTPSNVEVSQEEKERLQARGLFRGLTHCFRARAPRRVRHRLHRDPGRRARSSRGSRRARRAAASRRSTGC